MSSQDDCLIILEQVPAERQAEAALFLAGCFSLPASSTRGIAASGPIALLADVRRDRADSILNGMKASLPAGVTVRIVSGKEAGKIGRLQWPRPPRVYGRELSEYGDPDGSEISCPRCGCPIRVSGESGGLKAVPVRESGRFAIDLARRQSFPGDGDPLFSGVKPLAGVDPGLASLKSLEAGDTGFWMDHGRDVFSPPAPPEPVDGGAPARDLSQSVKTSARSATGSAAFMKPGGFALMIPRTRDGQAVKMTAEILGIGEDEARDRCLNPGICVARDISLDEAQNLLARFHNLGVKARIARPS